MMNRKPLKRLTAIALSMAMTLPGAMPVYAVPEGAERSSNTMPGYEELLAADYTLYLVKCGASDPAAVPDGYKMGLLQTVTDQKNGRDATGYTWGYIENDSSIIYGKRDTNPSSLEAGLRYMSDKIEYDPDASGITYQFEMPEGERTYQVTLGCKNPWDTRPADITLEGQTVKSSWSFTKDSLAEETFSVTVSDGVLDVRVHNTDRTSSSQDAMLSYIIIKAPYDQEYLKNAMKQYTLTSLERELYSVQSLEKYDEAYEYARRAAESEEPVSQEKIASNLKKLAAKYNGLQPKQDAVSYTSFSGTDGEVWLDKNGTPIQAHGGQVQKFTHNGVTKWYWYGEDKTDGYRTVDGGVRVYSSTDLYNWADEGIALRNLTDEYDFEEDYFHALYGDYTEEQRARVLLAINDTTSVIERPKVIYNEKNDNYVMWFHADGPTETSNSNYAAASAGVAVSDSPVGPFKFIDRYRLNYVAGKYDQSKGMARDMNLFVDDDGTGYIIYSSEENATLFISKLNEDYTYLSASPETAVQGVDFLRSETFAGQKREAPAMFKYDGKYYLMTSGCTGWGANQASFAVSENGILGDWKIIGDPCVTDTSVCSYTNALTFGTQSTNIIPIDAANGKFIYMGDRWNNKNPGQNELIDPQYVWLPVEFDGEGNMILRPYADWKLEMLDYMAPITVNTELPKSIKKGTALSELPQKLSITVNGETKETAVEWTLVSGDLNSVGPVTISGKMTGTGGRMVTIDGFVYSRELTYLVDCGVMEASGSPKVSGLYEDVKKHVTLMNETPDQKAEGSNTWGHGSGCDSLTWRAGLGLHSTGWYGKENKTGNSFSYEFTLDKGTYTITTGHTEWWSAGRTTNVTASYEGIAAPAELGSASWSGSNGGITQNVTGSITVPADQTKVTLTFTAGSAQAPVVSYIAIEKSSIANVFDDNLYLAVAAGKTPELPETVEAEMADGQITAKKVIWEMPEEGFYEVWTTKKVTGVLEGSDVLVTASVEVVPENLVYFIDSGFADGKISAAWQGIRRSMDLKNEAADQEFDGTWGYVEEGISPRNTSSGDKYENGFYAQKDQEIVYKLALPAGTYRFASGYQEWWAQWNSGRSMAVSLRYTDAEGSSQTEDLGTITLGNDTAGHVLESSREFELPADGIVEFHVKKNAALDVVLSWIAVQEVKKVSPSEAVDLDYEALDVYNINEVRGNLTLPETGANGTVITWESSDESVIAVTGLAEGTPIGVVSRPVTDTDVTLTATVTAGDVSREKVFTASVLAKPEEKQMESYVFAYFKGEGLSNGEQIYMASSRDGMNWEDLNASKPVLTSRLGEKGLRDPFIMRSAEGDKFYLIATDLKINGNNDWTAAQTSGSQSIMIWESDDLVNWSDQRMVKVAAEGAGCTWAPEAFYDETTGEYIVFWSSKIPASQNVENNDYTHRVYYAKTRDFYTFTEPEVWIELHSESGETLSVIDATVIKVGNTYYRFTKNEAAKPHREGLPSGGKYTMLETSDSLLGQWTEIESGINQISGVEGATAFRLNGEQKWCLLLDNFGGGGYFPLLTDDIGSGAFTRLDSSEYSFPGTMRHGSVLPVTADEYGAIMDEYGPAVLNSPDLTGTELMEEIIGSAAPVYEDTFDTYETDAAADKNEVLENEDGTKQYVMLNDSFLVKEDAKGNKYLQAAATTNIKLAQAGIAAGEAAGLTDALIMMDVMIPGTEENSVRSYAQIGTEGDRSYVKFDLKNSAVNIRENGRDDSASYTFEPGETYHVAVLYKDGSAYAYVNGKLIHKKAASSYEEAGVAVIAVATGGKIDNVRIYDASADVSEYEAVLESMKQVDAEDYDEEGWEEFAAALKKAEKLMKSAVPSKADLESVFQALADAYEKLTAETEYYTDRIKITRKPYQTEYEQYDDFNPEGMEMTEYRIASGSNAVRKTVLPEDAYELEYDFSELGDREVAVSYTAAGEDGEEVIFTDSITVKVLEEIEEAEYYTSRIAVTKKPDKREYSIGETFDASGMEVTEYLKASASNASPRKRVLSEEEYETVYDFSGEGSRKVTVAYYGTDKKGEEKKFTDYIVVSVMADTSQGGYTTGIRVTARPFKTEYETGEELDTGGMIVKRMLVKENGEKAEEILSEGDYTIFYDFSKAGTKKVVLSYIAEGKDGAEEVFETDFKVTVKKAGSDKPSGGNTGSGGSSGGSSGSGSSSGIKAASGKRETYYTEGSWSNTETGWQFKKADGTIPKSEWIYTGWGDQDDWYFFDENGNMVTGWHLADGKWFYLNPVSDGTRGRMVTGWQLIDDKWYYFNPVSDGTKGVLTTVSE